MAVQSFQFAEREHSTSGLADAVNLLLQEIPFFAVGPLGFAVATLMLVTKRIPRPGLFLVLSLVFAFISGLVNLFFIQENFDTDWANTRFASLAITSQVFNSLSLSARFLFFWDYASRSPARFHTDSVPARAAPPREKWSFVRKLLESLFFLLALAVAALQILWRRTHGTQLKNILYMSDAILEVALSVAFAIRIVCFYFLESPVPKIRYIRRSVPVLIALIISMGVAGGNLANPVNFSPFADTTLGHFLQAIEMYLVALVILLMILSPTEEPLPVAASSRRKSSFIGLPRLSMGTWRVSPPMDGDATLTRPARMSRLPTVERLSTWISQRLPNSIRQTDTDQDGLWLKDGDIGTQVADVEAQVVDDKQLYTPGEYSPAVTVRPIGPQDAAYIATATSALPSGVSEQFVSVTAPLDIRRQRRASIATSVVTERERRDSTVTDGTRTPRPRSADSISPVFGLEGIIRNLNMRTSDETVRTTTPSGAQMLRQREQELDRSVESLFAARLSTSVGTTASHLSSHKSDISLSNFPEPPKMPKGQQMIVDDIPFDLVQAKVSNARVPTSISGSSANPDRGSSNTAFIASYGARGASEASGFDVTSFIGGLTTPYRFMMPRPSIDARVSLASTESESSPVTATIVDVRGVARRGSLARGRIVSPSPLSKSFDEGSPATSKPEAEDEPAVPKSPKSPKSILAVPAQVATRPDASMPRRAQANVRFLPISRPIARGSGPLAPLAYDQPRAAPRIPKRGGKV